MNKHREPIYTPRFVGERFQEHSLPLEFLDDLQALGKINTAIAKLLWKEQNPKRLRTPRGFEKGISYAISEIKDGSAMPNVELIVPKNGLFPTLYSDFFREAPAKLKEAIQVLDEGRDPTTVLPQNILLMLESFGSSLRSDEHVEFRPFETRPARYTVQNRKKLILQVSKNKRYTMQGKLRGTLSELDKKKNTFHLQIVNGKTIHGSYSEELREEMMDAFMENQENSQKLIAIHGTVLFNASDFPVEIQKMTELEFLDPLDIGWRLEQISELNEGWHEGNGKSYFKNETKQLAEKFDEYFRLESLPHLYPTPNGNISAEWEGDSYDISVEIQLQSLNAMIHSLNFETDRTEELKLKLDDESGWNKLNVFLEERLAIS